MENSQESQEEPEEENYNELPVRVSRVIMIRGGWKDFFTGETFITSVAPQSAT